MNDELIHMVTPVSLIFMWAGFVRTGLGFGGAALGLPLMLLVGASPVYWLPVIGLHLLLSFFFLSYNSFTKSIGNILRISILTFRKETTVKFFLFSLESSSLSVKALIKEFLSNESRNVEKGVILNFLNNINEFLLSLWKIVRSS
jgi:hypothetical protein